MQRLVNWIEIPVTDMARAKAFYRALLGVELVDFAAPGYEYALFTVQSRTNAGALVKGEGAAPSMTGVTIYFDASQRIDAMIERAIAAGATLLLPKTRLSDEAGDVAFLRDTEGNRVGLQSPLRAVEPIDDGTMQRWLANAPRRFAVVIKPGPHCTPDTLALQWEHARNMFTLLARNALLSVTALTNGTDVLGVAVLEASSRDDVEALFAKDPAVLGGRLRFEVLDAAHFRSDEL